MAFPGDPAHELRASAARSCAAPFVLAQGGDREEGMLYLSPTIPLPQTLLPKNPILSCKVANPKQSDSAFLHSTNFLPRGRRGARSGGAPLSRWEAAWSGGHGRTVGDRSPRCSGAWSSACYACMSA